MTFHGSWAMLRPYWCIWAKNASRPSSSKAANASFGDMAATPLAFPAPRSASPFDCLDRFLGLLHTLSCADGGPTASNVSMFSSLPGLPWLPQLTRVPGVPRVAAERFPPNTPRPFVPLVPTTCVFPRCSVSRKVRSGDVSQAASRDDSRACTAEGLDGVAASVHRASSAATIPTTSPSPGMWAPGDAIGDPVDRVDRARRASCAAFPVLVSVSRWLSFLFRCPVDGGDDCSIPRRGIR